jgi:hypothetical protein
MIIKINFSNTIYMSNINYREKSVSIVKILLIYQFLIMTRSAAPLISPDVKKILDENIMAKHLMGIIFMVVTIQSFTRIRDPFKTVYLGIGTYLLFVLTTKLDLNMFIIVTLGLLGYLFYENSLENTERLINEVNNDELKKQILIEKENTKKWSVIGIISVLIVGFLLYVNRNRELRIQN